MRGTIPWSAKVIDDIAFLEGDAEVGRFGSTSMLKDGGELRVVEARGLYTRVDSTRGIVSAPAGNTGSLQEQGECKEREKEKRVRSEATEEEKELRSLRGEPPPRPTRPEVANDVRYLPQEVKERMVREGVPEELKLHDGSPVPTLMYRQSDRFVRDKYGSEREMKECDACLTQQLEKGFSYRMWNKRIGVRLCKGCLKNLTCSSCNKTKRPGEFSQTQLCKLQEKKQTEKGKVLQWGRRCNKCLSSEGRKPQDQRVLKMPVPLPKADSGEIGDNRAADVNDDERATEEEESAGAEEESAATVENVAAEEESAATKESAAAEEKSDTGGEDWSFKEEDSMPSEDEKTAEGEEDGKVEVDLTPQVQQRKQRLKNAEKAEERKRAKERATKEEQWAMKNLMEEATAEGLFLPKEAKRELSLHGSLGSLRVQVEKIRKRKEDEAKQAKQKVKEEDAAFGNPDFCEMDPEDGGMTEQELREKERTEKERTLQEEERCQEEQVKKAMGLVEGAVVCLVSRICENRGSRGSVLALGRTALGTKEEEAMAPLQTVEVVHTWSGDLQDGVMVQGDESQGGHMNVSAGGFIPGVWMVSARSCAPIVEPGVVCTVGAGEWEYLASRDWEANDHNPIFEWEDECWEGMQGMVPVSHWPEPMAVTCRDGEKDLEDTMGYIPFGRRVKVLAVVDHTSRWSNYAKRSVLVQDVETADEEVKESDFEPKEWAFDAEREPASYDTSSDVEDYEEPAGTNKLLEEVETAGCVVGMCKRGDEGYGWTRRSKVWIQHYFLYPDPLVTLYDSRWTEKGGEVEAFSQS